MIKHRFVYAHMRAAQGYADLSYCVRRKVGAVITKHDGYNVLAFGYNGMPTGEPNVCELEDGSTDPRVRHAEINALRKLILSTETSAGATMFVNHAPCPLCAIEISEARIHTVFFEHEYRDMAGVADLIRRGILVYQVNMFNGRILQLSNGPTGLQQYEVFRNEQ